MPNLMNFFGKWCCATFYLCEIAKPYFRKPQGQHRMAIGIQPLVAFQMFITLSKFLQTSWLLKNSWDKGQLKTCYQTYLQNGIASLVRGVSVADYKVSLQGNQKSVYSDNNKENDENEIDNHTDTVKGRGKNIENSNNVEF